MQKEYIINGKPITIFYEIDRFIKEIIINEEYEKWIDLVRLKGKKDLVIMDIGCNIGAFSLKMYDRAKKIYAIDVSPACINLLKQTIDYNKLDKIIPIQIGLSGKNEPREFTKLSKTDGNIHFIDLGETAETITLATLFEKYNIDHVDLLKIDVEGAEELIFEALDVVKLKGKIGAIIGEHGRNTESLDHIGLHKVQTGNYFYAV
jgi:FkbM family methyltransferase